MSANLYHDIDSGLNQFITILLGFSILISVLVGIGVVLARLNADLASNSVSVFASASEITDPFYEGGPTTICRGILTVWIPGNTLRQRILNLGWSFHDRAGYPNLNVRACGSETRQCPFDTDSVEVTVHLAGRCP